MSERERGNAEQEKTKKREKNPQETKKKSFTHDVRLPPALQQELQRRPAEPPEPRGIRPRVAVDPAVGELAVGGLDEKCSEALDDAGRDLFFFFFFLFFAPRVFFFFFSR